GRGHDLVAFEGHQRVAAGVVDVGEPEQGRARGLRDRGEEAVVHRVRREPLEQPGEPFDVSERDRPDGEGGAVDAHHFGTHLASLTHVFLRKIMHVDVACAYSTPASSYTRASVVATCPPPCTTRPSAWMRPVVAVIARTNLVLRSSVVNPASAGNVDATAQPIAVSTSVATMPPCIVPIGFSCISSATSENTVRPRSSSSSDMPSNAAAGGGSTSPRLIANSRS